jgi:hypothetical protein
MGDEFKISIKRSDIVKLKSLFNPSILMIILFIISSLLYLNIDKLPLTHPGNLKASDPFGHTIIANDIIVTEQWNYIGQMFSLGKLNEANPQPPLLYLNSAILSIFSGLPTWVTMYFLVCISQAFFVIVIYLITKEVFENNKTAILAAFFSILPLPISIWLYPLYVGMWIQVAAYFFLLAGIWLFIKYLKTKNNTILFLYGLVIGALILIHPTDIMLLFIPSLILGVDTIFESIKKKDLVFLIKKGLIVTSLPLIAFISMASRFLFVWRWHSSADQYKPGFYGLNNYFNIVKDNPVLQRVLPPFNQIPISQIVLFLIGFVLLCVSIYMPYKLFVQNNKIKGKKISIKPKLIWVIFTTYYFVFVYFAEVFLYQPYYIGRMRNLQPFIIYPTLAFFVISLIKSILLGIELSIKKNLKYKKIISYTLLILFMISFVFVTKSIVEYKNTVEIGKREFLSLHEYQAYQWLQQNSEPDETLLFFGGISQNEQLYSNRPHGVITLDEYQKLLTVQMEQNITQTNLTLQGWGGSTTRTNIIELGFMKYKEVDEPGNNVNIQDFDYIFFQDLDETLTHVNDLFAYQYITKLGFTYVYDQNGYSILKNSK